MPKELFRVDQLTMSPADAAARISQNWQSVQQDVEAAAKSAGRTAADVRIIGVSKYVDETITGWLVDAGCRDLGENRPQVLMQKHAALVDHAAPIRWHQIGHLQRNKVRRLLDAKPMIHSIDSVRLLDEIMAQSSHLESPIDVLIELNVSGEDAKTGLPPGELDGLLENYLAKTDHRVRIVGMMAMAGWGSEKDIAQKQFAALRNIVTKRHGGLTCRCPNYRWA